MPGSTLKTARCPDFRLLLVLVTLPLYAVDQLTKWAVVRSFSYEEIRPVIPGFFDLVRFHNTGAAFSIFSNSNIAFTVLSAVAILVLIVLAVRGLFRDTASRIGWALLMAGIIGNLTDRVVHGYVVDFLLFDLHVPFANPWPAFNVADACICSATALFLWQSFREPAKPQSA